MTERGLNLVRVSEGLRLSSYRCIAGVWTIGYGHTGGVVEGQTITEEEAERLFKLDILKFEVGVKGLLKVGLTDLQKDALTDFAFNLGIGALKGSTLLKKVNAGLWSGIDKEFERWVYAGGQKSAGLLRRRKEEAKMFCEEIAGL